MGTLHFFDADREDHSATNHPQIDDSPSSLSDADALIAEYAVTLDDAAIKELGDANRGFAQPEWEMRWVRTEKQLRELTRQLERGVIFAVDTETAATVPGKDLSEKLCLIQIGVPKAKKRGNEAVLSLDEAGKTYLIDVLALENESKRKDAKDGEARNPLQLLKRALEDPELAKIIQHQQFENGQFDKYGIQPRGVIDIEVLAKRFRPDLVSYSLASVALEVGGVLVSKEQQKSEWDRRPLTDEQVLYAALDTELNFKVWGILQWYSERLDNELAADLARAEPQPLDSQAANIDSQIDALMQGLVGTLNAKRDVLERSGVGEAVAQLELRADQYGEYLKKLALPQELAKIQSAVEQSGAAMLPGQGYEYKGVYGSAFYVPHPLKVLDLNVLKGIDPALVDEVVTFKATQGRIEQAVDELESSVSAAQIWKEVYQETGQRTEPSLKLELSDFPGLDKKKKIEVVPFDLSVEQTLRAAIETEITRLAILRDAAVGNELGFLSAKAALYRSEILSRLKEKSQSDAIPGQGAAYTSELGTVSFKTQARKEVNAELLLEKYPDVAAKAIEVSASQEKVEEALRKRGFDPQTVEQLMQAIFKTSGEWDAPRARIYPKYGLYYKGPEEEQLRAAA